MPACAAFKYDERTPALPTGRLLTSLPAEIWPWKSLKPSSFTFRLPPWHKLPSATVVCVQAEVGEQASVVQGLPSSQPVPHVGALQLMSVVSVSAQPAVVSPSETVSVSVALPAVVQVNVGLAPVALLSVPLDAVHW